MLLGAADGSRLASALALPVVTLALALRRRRALLPAAAITAVLVAQAAFGGFLVGHVVVPLVALVDRAVQRGPPRRTTRSRPGGAPPRSSPPIVATRIAFDPSVERWTDAVPTLVYVPLPLLVGRWVRGQVVLRRELEAKIEQLARERERGARQAAEDERVRITSDLQELVADGLAGDHRVGARALPPRLRSDGDHAQAPATFAAHRGDRARRARRRAARARDPAPRGRRAAARAAGRARRGGAADPTAAPTPVAPAARRSRGASPTPSPARSPLAPHRPAPCSTGCSSCCCSPAPRSSSPSRRPPTSA